MRERPRSGEQHFSGTLSVLEGYVAQPDLGHCREIGLHTEIDLESRVLDAQLGLRALENEPEQPRAAVVCRHAAVFEAHYNAARRQAIQRNAPAHVPHKETRIEVVALDPHGPALSHAPNPSISVWNSRPASVRQ